MPYLTEKDNPDLVYETIDDETVLVNLASGNYYSLVGVASEVWQALMQGIAVEELTDRLVSEYDASPNEIQLAVQEFIQALVAEQLYTDAARSEVWSTTTTTSPTTSEPAQGKRPFQPPRLQRFTDMQELLLLDPIHDTDDLGWPHPANEKPTN